MPLISRTIIESLAIASILAVISLFVAFIFYLGNQTILVLPSAASYMILEFGVMLILGSCLMARQPLDDDKRLDKDGNPVTAWKWAIRGRMVLVSSVFVLFLGIVLAFLGGFL
ncbi:MAG: hypothetical protein KAQ65_10150 [Candidatus Thorarchaeota archaeon]|nr:hypothetical protein [Candidatus Thorarchaeota archaeon]